MHTIKQIGTLAAKIEHSEDGQFVAHLVVPELKALEQEAFNDLANHITGLVYTLLTTRGLV